MKRIGRYSISDLSFERILLALRVRIAELPHTVSWKYSRFAKENKNRIQEYKDLHKGQRCFILANGPSLANTNLDLLKGEYSFGLNRIYLNFTNSNFRPTYYLAVNELILEQFAEDIAALSMPKFLNWNRRFFYDNSRKDIFFIKSKMVINDSFGTDLTKSIVVGGTVTFVALQLAFYMGFKQAILIGLDHKYVEKGIPSATETRTEKVDQSHFHPNYFPKGIKWQLPDLMRSEIDFSLAKIQYENAGREILDATPGGACPVFHRVEYSSLFTNTRLPQEALDAGENRG